MRVITLNESDFEDKCLRLQEAVAARFAPDLVVGIATGGLHVARYMFVDIPHVSVSRQRPSTRRKPRGIMASLPYCVTNVLRMLESAILSCRRPVEVAPPVIDSGDIAMISGARNILVVDDAVDSGATLAAVCAAVRASAREDARIMTAVVTVTTSRPLLRPDFCIFDNRTLVRFPWSKDFHKLP